MPAAAVIPAPIAYIKVVAVKKLVVGFEGRRAGPPRGRSLARPPFLPRAPACPLLRWAGGVGTFTVRKLECSRQARPLG